MRDASLAIMREIGVDTGGCNVQFAINPENGELVVIEMNPRVSRSSALASKATGFPIAKIAAKLAVGYTLDEIPNDITRETMASFEPTIDYCVVKIPRWTFEKFAGAEDILTTSMKSVGEVMAIGRTFKEALNKAICSLETGTYGLRYGDFDFDDERLKEKLITPNSLRLFCVAEAFRRGFNMEELFEYTQIDRWFLYQIQQIVELEQQIETVGSLDEIDRDLMKMSKEYGLSDLNLARLLNSTEQKIRDWRRSKDITPTYKLVDTCAAEFAAYTPYYYSTYEFEDEGEVSDNRKVIILGGGPNRIGQGIEFDYCCVHCSMALRDIGVESIMVNSNPETVSTDYDTSDRLYFEPLTRENVLNIIEKEKPVGVVVQFGGQTPLNLAVPLAQAGVPILGTSPDSIDRAEDRERFTELLKKLNLSQPKNAMARTVEEAVAEAGVIGYPVVVRPSYVLGGRAMEICYDEDALKDFMARAAKITPDHPILVDQFLQEAVEIDVDAVCDGEHTIVAGIMEHIEEAGIHSGDSACVLPPNSLAPDLIEEIKTATRALALELGVKGLMNIQYAVKGGQLFVLEVNPRASRTVPFVSKATGIPWAKVATRLMLGQRLSEMNIPEDLMLGHKAVKESVFPFIRFPGVDILLGPEMRSTGEVMGISTDFGWAFAKAQWGASQFLPEQGNILISVKDEDKKALLDIAKAFASLGYGIQATRGTAEFLAQHGLDSVKKVNKVREGRPHLVDGIKNKEVAMVVNTTMGGKTVHDSYSIRRAALEYNVPYTTTVAGARATVEALRSIKGEFKVKALQDYHKEVFSAPIF